MRIRFAKRTEPAAELSITMPEDKQKVNPVKNSSRGAFAVDREERLFLLSNAMESLSEMVVITDLDHKIIYVNSAIEKILGYRPQEVIGRRADEFFEGIPGNPEDLSAKIQEESHGEDWQKDIYNRRKDGKIIRVHLSMNWINNPAGEPIGSVGITTDITRKKEIEDKLRANLRFLQTVIDTIPSPFYFKDLAGRYQRCNSSFARLVFGLPVDSVIGRTQRELTESSGRELASIHEDKDRLLLENGGTQTFEMPAVYADGNLRDIVFYKSTYTDEKGQIAGLIGLMLDITDRKHMEERLKRANAELTKLDQMKSDFLSAVSHELRTPLTSICSFVDILLDSEEEIDTDRHEFLEIIKENAQRLTRLITNVLDIEKIEADMIHWEKEGFNLCDEVEKAVRSIRGIAVEKNVEIILKADRKRCPVIAGPDRIQQVLINLLSNAVEFSPEGGEITVTVQSEEKQGEAEARVAVMDRGPGISAENRKNIFKKFFQVTDRQRGKSGGSGLGLTICREIIDNYGGRIWAEERPGGGSIFRFTLPLQPKTPEATNSQSKM